MVQKWCAYGTVARSNILQGIIQPFSTISATNAAVVSKYDKDDERCFTDMSRYVIITANNTEAAAVRQIHFGSLPTAQRCGNWICVSLENGPLIWSRGQSGFENRLLFEVVQGSLSGL